jgi:hypothetical protein
MAALTASQGPQLTSGAAVPSPRPEDGQAEAAPAPEPQPEQEPGEGLSLPYHTDLPPLDAVGDKGAGTSEQTGGQAQPLGLASSASGIPATVLDAYRRAESVLADTTPGCGLEWEVLAAIGKVESGHAAGGAVDAEGTTLEPILGPVLNGDEFAQIFDTDGGQWDSDAAYDRAVGPMQFIPSTWASWGTDGNGDGLADPNNVYDAALAAGDYLCAGGRDLTDEDGLNSALLSYNHSWDYVLTVRAWLEFYLQGAHEVPDGEGPLPTSPGAGNPDGQGQGASPASHDDDRPPQRPSPSRPQPQDPRPSPSPTDPEEPTEPASPEEPTDPEEPDPSPSDPADPTEPEPSPSDPTEPEPSPSDPTEPEPSPSDPADPTEPEPEPSPSDPTDSDEQESPDPTDPTDQTDLAG